jgi:hypothetical protein
MTLASWLRGRRLAPLLACCGSAGVTRAEPAFDDGEILRRTPETRVESLQTRFTAYSQRGHGYQSQAGPLDGPGSEQLRVLQAQAEFVVEQGETLTHRLWVPVDIVTSASADAIDRHHAAPDVVSSASATNLAVEADYQLGIRASRDETYTAGVAAHVEEPFHSWALSLGYRRSLAENNAALELTAIQVFDWFDEFELGGSRAGRASRATSTLSLSLSQLLSPTTAIAFTGDVSLQHGELGNTWNTVPLEGGGRGLELLPGDRRRQAASVRFTQWLPWDAWLALQYRLYRDSWQVSAHSTEARVRQRLTPWLTLTANYRYHVQTGVSFFTTRSAEGAIHRSADSDLAELSAHTLGGGVTFTPSSRTIGSLFFDLGYDRYFRSDELTVEVLTWASGIRF